MSSSFVHPLWKPLHQCVSQSHQGDMQVVLWTFPGEIPTNIHAQETEHRWQTNVRGSASADLVMQSGLLGYVLSVGEGLVTKTWVTPNQLCFSLSQMTNSRKLCDRTPFSVNLLPEHQNFPSALAPSRELEEQGLESSGLLLHLLFCCYCRPGYYCISPLTQLPRLPLGQRLYSKMAMG